MALAYMANYGELVAGFMMDSISNVDNPDYVTFNEGAIGGPNMEVQINESAFGKWKYYHSYLVETKWVFGGVKMLRMTTVEKR